jgi:OFA family oxalate/formate antiporter-like MFS transporter
MSGAALFALGNLLAGVALATGNLPMLLFGYGVVGGIGLGLGYVTPVATAAKWFPDKKGLVTGMVVMGFGFGALFMSKLLAPLLLSATGENYATMFMLNAAVIAALALPAAACLRNPPVPSTTAPASGQGAPAASPGLSLRASLLSARFARMWLLFFCNITAGIMFIGFQSPMLQDLLKSSDSSLDASALALAGASLIAVSSVCNGLGRLGWAGLSDRIGRPATFRLILGSQVLVFAALTQIGQPLVFAVLVCYILLCYGGGFGSMPSFVLDVFGKERMALVYGSILTAWSLGGIAGPQIVAAIRDLVPAGQVAAYTFGIAAGLLTIGLALSLRPFPPMDGEGAKG